MNRRSFLASLAASALVLPWEPKRVYSFASELRVPHSERWWRVVDLETARRIVADAAREMDECHARVLRAQRMIPDGVEVQGTFGTWWVHRNWAQAMGVVE